MAYVASRLSHDQNLGLYIDGKESFKGQKKTGRVGVTKPIGKASFRGQKKSGGAGVRKPIGDLPNSVEPPIINQPGGKRAQDGKESFKGQKKTGRVGVTKSIGKASFRGQKKSGGAGLRKPIGDLPNSGEPPVINQPGEKKAQDGPLTSGKQLKSNELANLKVEAVPSKEKGVDIYFDEKTRDYPELVILDDTMSLFKRPEYSECLFNFSADGN